MKTLSQVDPHKLPATKRSNYLYSTCTHHHMGWSWSQDYGLRAQICLKSNAGLSPDSQNLGFKVWDLNMYTWILLPIRASPILKVMKTMLLIALIVKIVISNNSIRCKCSCWTCNIVTTNIVNLNLWAGVDVRMTTKTT